MKIQTGKREIDYQRFYALVEKLKVQQEFRSRAKQDFFGSAPNVFVGRFGYPNIDVGVLNTQDRAEEDNPRQWAANNWGIPEVVKLRSQIINSNFRSKVRPLQRERLMELSKEVSLAIKAPDLEVNLKKAPVFNLALDQELTPYGPSVRLKKARLTENPKIPHQVDYVVNDDLKAVDQVSTLYQKGYDEHYLTKILSMGNLGMSSRKKLVPTRWSITATDDMLGRLIIKRVRDFAQHDYAAYFGGYLGNWYLVLLFPEPFRYELFEIDPQSTKAWTDYEDVFGQKSYASNTAGGYYASRLPILEILQKKKRQASILALRFMTQDYYLGLGVWVVREATRKAMVSKPHSFADKEALLRFARSLAQHKFGFNLDPVLQQSKLLEHVGKQKTLFEF